MRTIVILIAYSANQPSAICKKLEYASTLSEYTIQKDFLDRLIVAGKQLEAACIFSASTIQKEYVCSLLRAIITTIIDACLTPSSQKVARSPALTISQMLSSLPSSLPFIFVFTCARALEGSMATSTDNIQRLSFWGCENYVDKICTIVKDIEYEDALPAHEGAIKENWNVLKTKEFPDAAEATFELAPNGILYVGAKDKGYGTIEKITNRVTMRADFDQFDSVKDNIQDKEGCVMTCRSL